MLWGAGIAGETMDFGSRATYKPQGIPSSRVVLFCGRNWMTMNVHMVLFLKEAKARGGHPGADRHGAEPCR